MEFFVQALSQKIFLLKNQLRNNLIACFLEFVAFNRKIKTWKIFLKFLNQNMVIFLKNLNIYLSTFWNFLLYITRII